MFYMFKRKTNSNKDKSIGLRVTDVENDILDEKANERGIKKSEYIRKRLFNDREIRDAIKKLRGKNE